MKYKWLPKFVVEEELEVVSNYIKWKNYKQEYCSEELYLEQEQLSNILCFTPQWRWVINDILYIPKLLWYWIKSKWNNIRFKKIATEVFTKQIDNSEVPF